MADRKLIVRVIGDERQLLKSFRNAEVASTRFSRTIERNLGTGAGKRARSFQGAVSSVPLLGGIGAASALVAFKRVIDAAKESEVVLGQTQVAVEALGLSWADNSTKISQAADRISKASSFDDEAVLQSFQLLVRSTGDVDRALQLTSLSADVARARYTDLGSAAALVNKASLGQIGALRRLGIQVDKNATATEALALLQQKFAGASANYSKTAGGASDRLDVALGNLSETAGGLLTPALVVVADNLTDVAANAEIAAGGVGVLAGAFKDLADKVPDPGGKFGQFFDLAVNVGKRLNPVTGSFQLWADAIKLAGLNAGNATPQVEGLTQAAERFRKATELKAPGGGSLFENPLFDALKGGAAPPFKATATPPDLAAGMQGFFDLLGSIPDQVQSLLDQANANIAKAEDAARKQRDGFENLMGRLSLRFDTAAATNNLRGELAALRAQERVLRDQIKVEGHTVDLDRQLFQLQQERSRIRQERVTGNQFKALGLNADGTARVPGVENLRKQLGTLTERVKGTPLDTAKTRGELARIARVLSGQFGKVGDDVRSAILGMFEKIRDGFKDGDKTLGPLTKTTSLNTRRIVEGLGLSASEAKEIRARLSRFNSAGVALAGTGVGQSGGSWRSPTGGPFVVESYVTVQLDGETVGRSVTRSQQKRVRRNPKQKRGPMGGV